MLHWYEIEPKQWTGQCKVAQFQSIGWALSSNAKTEGFATFTSSFPPTVGGDGGEGDVEADGDERCRTGGDDGAPLSSPGLHPGAPMGSGFKKVLAKGPAAGGEEGRRFPSGGVGGERDKRTVAAAELATQRAEVTKICEIWSVVSAWTAGFGGNFCTRSRLMKIDVISLSTRN